MHRFRVSLLSGLASRCLAAVAPVLVAAFVWGPAVGAAAAPHPTRAFTRPIPVLVGGMRGTVAPYASGVEGDTGWLWFTRCLGKCDGFSARISSWLATTTDGGRTWTVARRARLQIPPVSGSAQDKWAGSVGDDGGGGVVVTHDGGSSWRAVHVPRSPNFYSVSVAGGEAWAVGSGCSGICGGRILRGPASGSQLKPTPTPPRHSENLVQLVALSADSAYLYTPLGAGHRSAWLTTDSGRRWQQVAPGCPSYTVSGSSIGAIWRSCQPSDGHSAVGISTDGGRHWVYRSASFSTGVLYPSSAQIAWAQTQTGATVRTTDGGRSWHTVWSPPGDGRRAALSVQSSTTATEAVPKTHTQAGVQRTNLVVYRTTDGGSHWQQTAVPLPPR